MCASDPPDMPEPEPVIERQPYKEPVSRDQLSSGKDMSAKRRRALMGVVTSVRGVTGPASTTADPAAAPSAGRQKTGGDQTLLPDLGVDGSADPRGVGTIQTGGGKTGGFTLTKTGSGSNSNRLSGLSPFSSRGGFRKQAY